MRHLKIAHWQASDSQELLQRGRELFHNHTVLDDLKEKLLIRVSAPGWLLIL
jgi:hypothetical protein